MCSHFLPSVTFRACALRGGRRIRPPSPRLMSNLGTSEVESDKSGAVEHLKEAFRDTKPIPVMIATPDVTNELVRALEKAHFQPRQYRETVSSDRCPRYAPISDRSGSSSLACSKGGNSDTGKDQTRRQQDGRRFIFSPSTRSEEGKVDTQSFGTTHLLGLHSVCGVAFVSRRLAISIGPSTT